MKNLETWENYLDNKNGKIDVKKEYYWNRDLDGMTITKFPNCNPMRFVVETEDLSSGINQAIKEFQAIETNNTPCKVSKGIKLA